MKGGTRRTTYSFERFQSTFVGTFCGLTKNLAEPVLHVSFRQWLQVLTRDKFIGPLSTLMAKGLLRLSVHRAANPFPNQIRNSFAKIVVTGVRVIKNPSGDKLCFRKDPKKTLDYLHNLFIRCFPVCRF